jgi:hypothetical protein
LTLPSTSVKLILEVFYARKEARYHCPNGR